MSWDEIRHKGQSTLLDGTKQPSILVLGCWGVGSAAAFCLAKMWLSDITLVDKDNVENHNIASQMYKESQKDVPKVEALASNIKEFSGVECKVINDRWTPELAESIDDPEIVILAIDNMDIRKAVVDHYKDDPFCKIIESRMGGTEYIIQVINDYDVWLASWFPQEEADPEQCTAKSICWNTFSIGGKIGELVNLYIEDKPYLHYNHYCSDDIQGKTNSSELWWTA